MFIAIKCDFLKKNNMILTKQCLFELIIKKMFIFIKMKNVDDRLIMFFKIKNINDCLICVLSCDSNKFDMILFMNVIFENAKNEVYEFEIRF